MQMTFDFSTLPLTFLTATSFQIVMISFLKIQLKNKLRSKVESKCP